VAKKVYEPRDLKGLNAHTPATGVGDDQKLNSSDAGESEHSTPSQRPNRLTTRHLPTAQAPLSKPD